MVTLEIVSEILARADNPGLVGAHITSRLRDLSGAKAAMLLQYLHGPDPRCRVVNVCPERWRNAAERSEIQRLGHIAETLPAPACLTPDSADDAGKLLAALQTGPSIAVPLAEGSVPKGLLLLLDVPSSNTADAPWTPREGLLETLNVLARLAAVVLRHSFLFEQQQALMLEHARRLEQSEFRYRELFETSLDGMAITDLQGRYLDCNSAYLRLLGCDGMEELRGKTYLDVTPPEYHETEARLMRDQTFVRGYCDEFEKEYIRKSGERVPVSVRCWLRRDAAGQPIGAWGIARDISERKRAEEALRQAAKLDAVAQLAGGIAHDFNNQLFCILGYGEILVDRLSDPKLARYAGNIVQVSQRAAALTAQLLAFARGGKYLAAAVDVHKILGDVASLLLHSIDRKITITQALKAMPAVTVGDPSQLQNVFLNIGLNARDAMPDGGELTFATEIAEVTEESVRLAASKSAPPGERFDMAPGRYLAVSVTDTGAGMDGETQKRLFEPFFTTKGVGQGTGMGLAAAYGIVRNHKGTIRVRSQEGRGSTFVVYLPVMEEPCAATGPRPNTKRRQGVPRILVVDDEDAVREVVAEALRDLGYEVHTCPDGAAAVEYYRSAWRGVDLVLVDLVMPKMSGRETFAALRRVNPDVRAIVATGYSLDGEAQRVLDEGAVGFVQKPFRRADLAQKVAQIVGAGTE